MLTFYNPSQDPYYNQAFEEYIFNAFLEDDIFFLWQNRPAVIVGRYQNICREVRAYDLWRNGIPIVRRISGGGTVYHDNGNINYTLILRQEGQTDYDRCLTPVIRALQAVGVPARKNRTSDIAIGDQRISGSAQRATGGRLLHHGTLLFDADLEVLNHITTQHKNDHFRSTGTVSNIRRVTNIKDHLHTPMSMATFQSALLAAMLPEKHSLVTLTAAQEEAICTLRDTCYRSWDWTWGKNPTFSYARQGQFAGAPIDIAYQTKGGVVSEPIVHSAHIDAHAAATLLEGARLDPAEFEDICRQLVGPAAPQLMNWLM